MEKVTTADARKNFADVVNQVAYGKEPIVFTVGFFIVKKKN